MNLAEMLKAADAATNGVEIEDGGFTPVPPGTYAVAVVEAEGPIASKRANPNNPTEFGQLIKMTLTITDGEHAGRKLFLRNNIIVFPASMSAEDQSKAQKAMAMGAKERRVILDSLGKAGIEDASELVGATFKVQVVNKTSQGKPSNEIARVMPMSASAAPAAQPPKSSSPANPAKPVNKLPWEV